MSELLDAFDDEGLTDEETRRFLVDALINSESSDWKDILEPFLQPDRALEVLNSVPNVLDRSLKAFEVAAVEAEEVSATSRAFLEAFPHGVLQFTGLHTLARCARTCREAQDITCQVKFWMLQIETMCSMWKVQQPIGDKKSDKTWKQKYFVPVRPRCDGIYVGECSFKRWIRVGHHSDLRKNAAGLAAYGGRGGHDETVKYRRYVRLFPPSEDGSLWAYVLMDPCPRAIAEQVLMDGVNHATHVNTASTEVEVSDRDREVNNAERVRKKLCVGQYKFAEERIEIRYRSGVSDQFVSMKVSHLGPRKFADRLEWNQYQLSDDRQGEVQIDLGKLPEWKGGGLSDEKKDHFPDMLFLPICDLEHLL